MSGLDRFKFPPPRLADEADVPADNAARRAALAAEIGAPVKRPDVWFGAHGPDVEYLQQQLEQAGLYSVADGDQPGRFAHMTERALRTFQTARGLPVNGYCGPDVWAALR